MENTRNFCIVAHIDHGKSTLADRMMLAAKAVTEREFRDQLLDDMDLERERGITIKSSAVTFTIERGGATYILNLIDTPGHVDFHYEVSRSLTACDGAILLVDATQGVQAQTIANAYKALDVGLTIIPVMNKIDSPIADPDTVAEELGNLLGEEPEDILGVSAKDGTNVDKVFDLIVDRVPPPQGDPDGSLRALVFDSVMDTYRGVISHVRVFDGTMRKGDQILMARTGRSLQVTDTGRFTPRGLNPTGVLGAGDVGYCIAGVKEISTVKVGDTIVHEDDADVKLISGYEDPKPMVFCGLYPSIHGNFDMLREALEELHLNDCSFVYQPENSQALGPGFRCGFLGLLHMEIIQQRLEREADLDVVQTAPTVTYQILKHDGEIMEIDNPDQLPSGHEVKELREPVCNVSIITPSDSLGVCMKLVENKRGKHISMEYISPQRVIINYKIPMAEMLYDFYDKLKSATHGYGTMDYEFIGFEKANLVKVDFLVAGERVDALSTIMHKDVAQARSRVVAKKLKEEIPRHLFEVVIQAQINGRISVRESIPALGKNVTAKLYGGDVTRKRKLWAKQREGKKRLKQIGQVDVPQEAFLAVLKAE